VRSGIGESMSKALPNIMIGASTARIPRRGVSLVESVIAATVLCMSVLAVFAAIGAGTAHAEESARRIAATMAAEDLLARVLLDRGEDLDRWDGYHESLGNLTDLAGRPLAQSQQKVSRQVEVDIDMRTLPGFTSIEGRRVRVATFDAQKRQLDSISEWVANEEPSP
jgi:hypothetical protein